MSNITNFNEFGLKQEIVDAISAMGFVEPTPIQQKSIPFILNDYRDLIALAQTGTGKTASFGLPVLSQIDPDNKDTQLLVLCPTRELCLQIAKDLTNFSANLKGLGIVAVYGGASIENQIKALKKLSQVVVATPGRAIDLMERKALKLNNIQYLVLDEADEMLSMGFKEDLDTILGDTRKEKRTFLFSATMPADIERMAKSYMNEFEEIQVAQKNIASENVEHQYFLIRSKDRYEALKRIADVNPNIYAIVFCRTRQETKEVADQLIEDHYNADALHGDLSQAQRDNVMQRFRNKHLQILVATDVAARGLDVNDLTHVINYNLPDDPEVYIHRSGRTGRAGKSGISISLIHLKEKGRMKDIERLCKKKFVKKDVPQGEQICEIRLMDVISKMKNVEIDHISIDRFIPKIEEMLEGMSREEIIKKFVSMEFNRFIDYYRNAPDINISDDKKDQERGQRKSRKSGVEYSRLFISIGTKDRLQASNLIGFINRVVNDRDVIIGQIDIMRNFSFFEIDQEHEAQVINAMNGAEFDEIPVSVEKASKKNYESKGDFNEKRSKKSSRSDRDNRRERGDRKDRNSREERIEESRAPKREGNRRERRERERENENRAFRGEGKNFRENNDQSRRREKRDKESKKEEAFSKFRKDKKQKRR